MPIAALVKSALACAALMALGMAWASPGFWLAAKFAALSGLGLLGLTAIGEFRLEQVGSILRLVAGDKAPERRD